MPDREKVIKGLECCSKGDSADCDNCNYHGAMTDVPCESTLMRDALALLKAQEPRVMTLEEVNALDWDYCYLEQERLPGKEYRGMLGKYIMTCVTWPSITAAKISQGKDNYGRTWRCWTSRPTDAQREATQWE
jgi:hypothetical protein